MDFTRQSGVNIAGVTYQDTLVIGQELHTSYLRTVGWTLHSGVDLFGAQRVDSHTAVVGVMVSTQDYGYYVILTEILYGVFSWVS